MVLELHIPACIHDPPHPLHLPPLEKPLRIQIEGPLVAVNRILPVTSPISEVGLDTFPQPGGLEFARLAYRRIYGQDARPEVAGDFVMRDETKGWVETPPTPVITFDYYGVTFDHLVPADDRDPDVLHLGIIELEVEQGPFAGGTAYAHQYLQLVVDPADYVGKRVLAVPRCCSKRKGTQDRGRINKCVAEMDQWLLEELAARKEHSGASVAS